MADEWVLYAQTFHLIFTEIIIEYCLRAFKRFIYLIFKEMLTQNLGYPPIGSHRELKKVCENYRADKTGYKNVLQVGKTFGTTTGNFSRKLE